MSHFLTVTPPTTSQDPLLRAEQSTMDALHTIRLYYPAIFRKLTNPLSDGSIHTDRDERKVLKNLLLIEQAASQKKVHVYPYVARAISTIALFDQNLSRLYRLHRRIFDKLVLALKNEPVKFTSRDEAWLVKLKLAIVERETNTLKLSPHLSRALKPFMGMEKVKSVSAHHLPSSDSVSSKDSPSTESPSTEELVPADLQSTESPSTEELVPADLQSAEPLSTEPSPDELQSTESPSTELVPADFQSAEPLSTEPSPDELQFSTLSLKDPVAPPHHGSRHLTNQTKISFTPSQIVPRTPLKPKGSKKPPLVPMASISEMT